MASSQSEKTLVRILGLGSFLVTVLVVTSGVSDPVNATKLFLLGGQAGALLLLLIASFRHEAWTESKLLLVTIGVFLLFGFYATFSSSAPLVQNIYGISGRNTGLLTYIFLSVILFAASLLRSIKSYRFVVLALLSAGAINIVYCLWVISFGDFIQWNNPYGNILGTFGNPNFIGSFLGMIFAVLFTWGLHKNVGVRNRALVFLAMAITAFEIQDSSAVQGKVVAIGGAGISLFYWIRAKDKFRFFQIPYLLLVGVVGSFAVAGALQRGPLADLIYKTSVSLRGEYWAAGIRMGLENPISGVGMDTYGDFYRRFRDEQALVLPGPNTVTNAAHNVFIDFFASGGFPLVASYLALVLIAGRAIFLVSRRLNSFDPVFVSLVTAWSGYQVQSIISINQIGLAVWGWLLTGAIIGYEKISRVSSDGKSSNESTQMARKSNSTRVTNQSYFSSSLLGGIGLVGGLLLAAPPLSADMAWTKSVRSQVLSEIEKSLESSYLTPLNSFKLAQIVQLLEQSKLNEQAHVYALKGVEFNPDYFEAWKLLYFATNSTEEEKRTALSNMKRLDPLNRNLLNQ
jgi:O-antigen ligase